MNLKKNTYLQIGLMVVFALTAFVWGYNYLKGRNILKPSNIYYITYDEVSGLLESDAVLIRGVKVGQVIDKSFDQTNPKYIVVSVEVENDVRIPVDSKVALVNINMLGSKGIKLDVGLSTHYYEVGDTIRGVKEVDMISKLSDDLGPIKEKGVSLLSTADSTMMGINDLVSEESVRDLKATFANLNRISSDLATVVAANRAGMSATLQNINLMIASITAERENIASLLSNLKTFSDGLSQADMESTMAKLDNTMGNLDELTRKMNEEEGSLQLLMSDPTLYNNMAMATENANLLLENFRKQPNRYVHFSLINRSKSSYMNEDGIIKKLSEDQDLSYMIIVKKTSNAVSIDKTNFVNPSSINEFKYGGTFYYYTGEFKDYAQVLERFDAVQKEYFDASVLVLKKGKPIPIEKVMK